MDLQKGPARTLSLPLLTIARSSFPTLFLDRKSPASNSCCVIMPAGTWSEHPAENTTREQPVIVSAPLGTSSRSKMVLVDRQRRRWWHMAREDLAAPWTHGACQFVILGHVCAAPTWCAIFRCSHFAAVASLRSCAALQLHKCMIAPHLRQFSGLRTRYVDVARVRPSPSRLLARRACQACCCVRWRAWLCSTLRFGEDRRRELLEFL